MSTNFWICFSFEINKGDKIAIIGKNGAGKSTLVRAILKDVPTEGTIEYRDTKNGKMRDLKIGYVPQSINIEKNTPLSVYDLIASFQYHYPVFLPKNKRIYAEIKKYLETFEAADLIDKQVCKEAREHKKHQGKKYIHHRVHRHEREGSIRPVLISNCQRNHTWGD